MSNLPFRSTIGSRKVDGWNDPRIHAICGTFRRVLRIHVICAFVIEQRFVQSIVPIGLAKL